MSQFTVKASKLNKRSFIPRQFPEPLGIVGIVKKDFSFEGEEVSTVDIPNTALGKWYVDRNNIFYWGGGIKINDDFNKAELEGKQIFQWFKDLKIVETWNKYTERGKLVTIAILDTGYNKDNLDIANAVFKKEVIIDSEKYNLDQLIIDDKSKLGHGNRCASIIGARNELQSILGIAPECKLIIGKISINREIRKFDYILNGIQWAISNGADIISISYAVELTTEEAKTYNVRLEEIIKNNSTLIFAAAGNSDGTPVIGERYPASFPGCISVGATDKNKNISDFTIISTKTVLHAQGVDIDSYGRDNSPDPQTGTSYSTPIVAAIAGLAVSFSKRKGNKVEREDFLKKLINTGETIQDRNNKKLIDIENLFKQL